MQCSFMATLNGIPERLPHRSHSHLITGRHHHRRKSGLLKYAGEYQALFNIHNPSQDHRDRG
jgi:hypothetical protein